MSKALQPVVITPVNVVEGPGITITEYFGNVASKDGTVSIARATVKHEDQAAYQQPEFAEYVMCDEGEIEFVHTDLTKLKIKAGEGAYLPKGLRVKWTWPSATKYTAVCLPAFSPALSGTEVDDPSCTVVNHESRRKLARLHEENGSRFDANADDCAADVSGAKASLTAAVDVVNTDAITITEYFGHVASKAGTASLAKATVRRASEEAFQTPQFDEYVVCTHGSINFCFGNDEVSQVKAGESVFLPKGLRVKWVWPEPANYIVLCLPAFCPELSGREAVDDGVVAKDGAAMIELQALHDRARGS